MRFFNVFLNFSDKVSNYRNIAMLSFEKNMHVSFLCVFVVPL